nr:ATP-grasp domain-containing protein [uncultured Allomuricauda sp.]
MATKLAIIGASYLQRPLVLKAKEMGLETYCFAWEEGAVCKAVCDHFFPISVLDKEQILSVCKKIKVDGIITIASDIATPTVCYVSQKLGLVSNSPEVAINTTNKAEMRRLFANSGIPSPRFNVVSVNEDIPEINAFPVIVKPTDRSGSRGVNRASTHKELANCISKAFLESLSKTVIIEEYIEGREVSVEAISWKGRHYILAITDKETSGPPHFVEIAHHQPSNLDETVISEIRNITENALNSLGVMYGASHSEFKIDGDGNIFVIEIGARMGGDFIGSDLVMLSTGYDFLKATINVALNKFEEPKIVKESFAGIYFLSKESERLIPYFEAENIFDHYKEQQNNALKTLTNSSDRSGFLIYKSNCRVEI